MVSVSVAVVVSVSVPVKKLSLSEVWVSVAIVQRQLASHLGIDITNLFLSQLLMRQAQLKSLGRISKQNSHRSDHPSLHVNVVVSGGPEVNVVMYAVAIETSVLPGWVDVT